METSPLLPEKISTTSGGVFIITFDKYHPNEHEFSYEER
jgi:hypothetical protein